MPTCIAPLCGNTFESGYPFHTLPTRHLERAHWIKLIRVKDYVCSKNHRLCGWHFPNGRAFQSILEKLKDLQRNVQSNTDRKIEELARRRIALEEEARRNEERAKAAEVKVDGDNGVWDMMEEAEPFEIKEEVEHSKDIFEKIEIDPCEDEEYSSGHRHHPAAEDGGSNKPVASTSMTTSSNEKDPLCMDKDVDALMQGSRANVNNIEEYCKEASCEGSNLHYTSSHIRQCHPEMLTFACHSNCGRKFTSQQELDTHMMSHPGHKGLFTCQVCSNQFTGAARLDQHLRSHTGEKLVCGHEGCNYACLSQGALAKHFKGTGHGHGQNRFRCLKCPKVLTSFLSLSVHDTRVHSTGANFICFMCGKMFSNETSLNDHMPNHTKSWTCDLCNKTFPFSASRREHRDRHFGVKKHCCRFCDKRFVRRDGLTLHERIHTGTKPYKCNNCGVSFTQLNTLKGHQKSKRCVKTDDPAPDPTVVATETSNVGPAPEPLEVVVEKE